MRCVMPRPPAAAAEPNATATGTTPLPARDMLGLEAGEPALLLPQAAPLGVAL